MKKYLSILPIVLAITSCATNTPRLTLDEKLQGKYGEERKEVLRLACLNEAEWPIYNSSKYKAGNDKQRMRLKHAYNAEVSEMKSLCRKMTESENSDKSALFENCKQKIAAKSEKHGNEAADHTKRTLQICQEMTGEKAPVKKAKSDSKPKKSE